MSASILSFPFSAWLRGDSPAARLANELIAKSADPEVAKAIAEIGFVEGCVHGAEHVEMLVRGSLLEAGRA